MKLGSTTKEKGVMITKSQTLPFIDNIETPLMSIFSKFLSLTLDFIQEQNAKKSPHSPHLVQHKKKGAPNFQQIPIQVFLQLRGETKSTFSNRQSTHQAP